MYRELRRSDRKLSSEEAIELLGNGEYGFLSMSMGEKGGYGVPISYAYDDGVIYVHCAKEGHKVDLIVGNPNVSFTVVGETEVIPKNFTTKYKSVIVFGIAEIVKEHENKKEALIKICEKYSSEYMDAAIKYINSASKDIFIIKIKIEHMTCKGRK